MNSRPFTQRDSAAVRALLEDWFRELTPGRVDEEVDARMELIADAIRAAVVDVDGEVGGVAALLSGDLSDELRTDCERPIEVSCVYVHRGHMRRGVGGSLLDRLESEALALGFSDVVAVSGLRHREIGYPFWNSRYGRPVRVDENYWDDGAERVVWRKRL